MKLSCYLIIYPHVRYNSCEKMHLLVQTGTNTHYETLMSRKWIHMHIQNLRMLIRIMFETYIC